MQRCFAPKKRILSVSCKKSITMIPKFDLNVSLVISKSRITYAPKKLRQTLCKRDNIKIIPKFNLDDFENLLVAVARGKSAANGKKYENDTLNICQKTKFKGCSNPLTLKKSTAGSTAGIDITIQYGDDEIGIECKKKIAEGMQLSLQFDKITGTWRSGGKNKIPHAAKELFEKNIDNMNIFNGNVPIFMNEKVTHDEWLHIKKNSSDFSDHRIPCSKDLISKMYYAKGCQYIQIGSHGLYHTYQDVCGFGVPYFACDSFIRIRTKIHARKNKQGHMSASVTSSVVPQMSKIKKSPYSLDNFDSLPKNVQLL